MSHEISPSLSANEKLLICGESGPPNENREKDEKKKKEGIREGWKQIPANQAIALFRTFLQRRGYFHPSFTQTSTEITVEPGPVMRVSSIHVRGSPPQFDITRKRGVLHNPLTSDLLDDVNQWTQKELGRLGYPCSEVKLNGDPETGILTLTITAPSPSYLNTIHVNFLQPARNQDETSQNTSLLDALRRYDAFQIGSIYNAHLLAITADRAITDGIVESTFFTPQCPSKTNAPSDVNAPDRLDAQAKLNTVDQQVIPGQSRIFSLGFGLNTEEIGTLRAAIKKVRIGAWDSSATAEVYASWRLQQVSALFDWQFASPSSPSLLRPLIKAFRQNENPFEFFSESALVGYVTRWDFTSTSLGLLTGPQFQIFQTIRGAAPQNPYNLGLVTELRWVSHEYEFNRTQLNSGYRLILQSRVNDQNLLSNFGALELRLRGEKIWNIGLYDPPFFLVHLRGGYGVVLPEGTHTSPIALPSDYQQFLGGIANLRGFGRLELPSASPVGMGGFSSLYFTLDLKPNFLGTSLGKNLQPGAFADLGAIGLTHYFPQLPLYWSPGIELDWKSPLGLLRSTLAHGFSVGPSSETTSSISHWQFYLSLGEPL